VNEQCARFLDNFIVSISGVSLSSRVGDMNVSREPYLGSESLGFWNLSIVQYPKITRKHKVWETGSLAVLRRGEGPLEKVNFNHCTRGPNKIDFPSPHLRTETCSLSETLCFLNVLDHWAMDKVHESSDSEVPTPS
jgi:hypothetical protein